MEIANYFRIVLIFVLIERLSSKLASYFTFKVINN